MYQNIGYSDIFSESETFNGPFIWMRSILSWNRDVPCDRHYLFTSPSGQSQVESHREEKEKKAAPRDRSLKEGERVVCLSNSPHISLVT